MLHSIQKYRIDHYNCGEVEKPMQVSSEELAKLLAPLKKDNVCLLVDEGAMAYSQSSEDFDGEEINDDYDRAKYGYGYIVWE